MYPREIRVYVQQNNMYKTVSNVLPTAKLGTTYKSLRIKIDVKHAVYIVELYTSISKTELLGKNEWMS